MCTVISLRQDTEDLVQPLAVQETRKEYVVTVIYTLGRNCNSHITTARKDILTSYVCNTPCTHSCLWPNCTSLQSHSFAASRRGLSYISFHVRRSPNKLIMVRLSCFNTLVVLYSLITSHLVFAIEQSQIGKSPWLH